MRKKELIACIAAGVIVVGGAGTVGGIALHNHNKNQDALAALESQMSELADAVTATETELVTETETETQPAPKPTETQAKPTQPTQAPQTTVAPPTCTEPEKITWEYNAELSQQVSELVVQRAAAELGMTVKYHPDFSNKNEVHPENFVHGNTVSENSSSIGIVKAFESDNIATQIIDVWSPKVLSALYSHNRSYFFVDVFQYSNGFYLATINFRQA